MTIAPLLAAAGGEADATARILLALAVIVVAAKLGGELMDMDLGTIEAGSAANGFWISLEPRFQVLDAPGLFDDIPHGYKMLNDPAIVYTTTPQNVMKYVDFMAKVGSIKVKPDSWKDLFFPNVHGAAGS